MILLGLEFLIAGDIIRTVVVSPTLGNVFVLGMIVLIGTFLEHDFAARTRRALAVADRQINALPRHRSQSRRFATMTPGSCVWLVLIVGLCFPRYEPIKRWKYVHRRRPQSANGAMSTGACASPLLLPPSRRRSGPLKRAEKEVHFVYFEDFYQRQVGSYAEDHCH